MASTRSRRASARPPNNWSCCAPNTESSSRASQRWPMPTRKLADAERAASALHQQIAVHERVQEQLTPHRHAAGPQPGRPGPGRRRRRRARLARARRRGGARSDPPRLAVRTLQRHRDVRGRRPRRHRGLWRHGRQDVRRAGALPAGLCGGQEPGHPCHRSAGVTCPHVAPARAGAAALGDVDAAARSCCWSCSGWPGCR